jgi:hypothetical protein
MPNPLAYQALLRSGKTFTMNSTFRIATAWRFPQPALPSQTRRNRKNAAAIVQLV